MSKMYEVYYGGIDDYVEFEVDDDTSDGYHTFGELYDRRMSLFYALCCAYPDQAWWSRKNSDEDDWGDYIVTGLTLPTGKQITYHVEATPEWLKLFGQFEELPVGIWDGHTSDDVLDRLKECEPRQ